MKLFRKMIININKTNIFLKLYYLYYFCAKPLFLKFRQHLSVFNSIYGNFFFIPLIKNFLLIFFYFILIYDFFLFLKLTIYLYFSFFIGVELFTQSIVSILETMDDFG